LRERRTHRRKSVLSELGELVVVMLDSERGLLLDLGAGGISVQTQNRLKPGSVFPVQFLLPLSQACVNPICEAVWSNDNCEAGLRILQLAEHERLTLGDWMAAHCEEPDAALSYPAPNEISGTLASNPVFSQTAYADLAATIQALITAEPLASDPAPEERPAAEPGTPEDFLVRVVAEAHSLAAADGAALVLRGEEGIVCRASCGNAPAVGSRLRADSGLSGECFRLGQVVRCDDVETDSRVNSAVAQRLQSRSILIVPILGEECTRGILQVLSSRPSAFNPAHIAGLEHLAGLVASFLAAEGKAQPSDLAPVIPREMPAAPIEPALPAVETELEARAQLPEPEVQIPSQPPPAAPIEPAQAVVEPEVADVATGQLAPEEPIGEAAQEAEVAAVVPVSDVAPITVAEPNSRTRARYVAFIGGLGLLIGASLAMFYVPQSNRTAQRASSVQPAEAMPLPTQPAPASQPKPAENAKGAEKDPPARPVSAPLHHDAGAQPLRRQRQRMDTPRSAPPIVSAPVAKPDSDKTTGNSPALAGNNPARSARELPPALTQADAGTPAAIAAILGAPVPAPALVPPPRPLRVSEGVVRGRAISQPKPVYPRAALSARIQGSVVLNATIGMDGAIKKLQVLKGNPLLTAAALDAVKKWRYQPYYLNGVPVEIESTITLNFKLP
jgi:TonB family protein